MPTYLELAAEPVWLAQTTPDVMTAVLLDPLRAFYNMGPSAIGAAGDNNHLYGRHRSRNWDLTSVYCTDRSYGTQDARDKQGDGDWYRAADIGIQGQTLRDASRRIDTLVRSGQAPGVAEWFGTYDGVNVVGWYEGHPSSSDDSHLYHLHVGFWTQYANDAATMTAVYQAITGTAPTPPSQELDMDPLFVKDKTGQAWIVDMHDFERRPVDKKDEPDVAYVLSHAAEFRKADGPVTVQNIDAFGRPASTGGGGTSGPVDLTPAAVEAVADATADELHTRLDG